MVMVRATLSRSVLPNNDVAKLALAFAELSASDLDASLILFEHAKYNHAIFLLQQAVEKATKAVGLLLGLVKPTRKDLMKVGHTTILGILLRYSERVEELRSQIELVSKSPGLEAAKREFEGLGLKWTLPEPSEMMQRLPSKETALQQIPMVRSLQPEELWDVTLRFDPSNPRVAVTIKMLDDAESQWKGIDEFALFLDRTARFLGDPEWHRYHLNISGKAFPEVAPLSFATMWHEHEPRYPPIETDDYWDPGRYSADSGIVRIYPRLFKHAKRLCEGTIAGAKAALKM
jgi:hypothetical protein